jgi:hypothetical protein
VRITNVIINNSTAPLQNTYIWVGTRDDFVGVTDVNTKTRGNLINGNFTAITANNQTSRAIMITNTNEGVLFYSETPGVMTAYALCCSFSNAYNVYPLTLMPATPSPTDGSYAAVLPLNTIPANSSASITWYYAAGVISSLASVAQTVAIAQVADAGPIATFTAYPDVPVPTHTAVWTFTSEPTATSTPTMSSTSTGTQTSTTTVSSSPTGTPTPTQSPSSTQTPSTTPSSSLSPTPTSTETPTQTPTQTPTPSSTESLTMSSTSTGTQTPTTTVSTSPTGTPTPSQSSSSTQTPSPTQTPPPTSTATSTSTQTSTQTPTLSSTSSSTASLLVRIVLVSAPQTNITLTQAITPLDNLVFIYTFVPINILVILVCCCIGSACYYFYKKKPEAEKVDENSANVEEGQATTVTEQKVVLIS